MVTKDQNQQKLNKSASSSYRMGSSLWSLLKTAMFFFSCCHGIVLLVSWILFPGMEGADVKSPSSCDSYPCLIFHDNFDKLDFTVWEHLITRWHTGNEEFQYYTNNRSNSYTKDGTLYLRPTLTNDSYDITGGVMDLWGSAPATYCTSNRYNEGCYGKGTPDEILNPIQSAGIRTEKSFNFKYGKLEVRAQMPRGDWLWPSVWMMPKYNVYGEWPASGEIDVFESRGNDELYSGDQKDKDHVGNKMVSQSLHWGPYYPEDGHPQTLIHVVKKKGRYSDGFHLYSVEWTPQRISFSIDDHVTLNITVKDTDFWKMGKFGDIGKIDNPWVGGTSMAPFDEDFYIIMNVAVGGTNNYFHDAFTPRPPWKNDGDGKKAMKDFWDDREKWLKTWNGEQVALKVDYLKVWKLDAEN